MSSRQTPSRRRTLPSPRRAPRRGTQPAPATNHFPQTISGVRWESPIGRGTEIRVTKPFATADGDRFRAIHLATGDLILKPIDPTASGISSVVVTGPGLPEDATVELLKQLVDIGMKVIGIAKKAGEVISGGGKSNSQSTTINCNNCTVIVNQHQT